MGRPHRDRNRRGGGYAGLDGPGGLRSHPQGGDERQFLAEFRPVAAVFVSFGEIDYEDPDSGAELDAFIRRAQDVVMGDGGSVFDISLGDKGSYLLAVFSTPVARGDEVRRAVSGRQRAEPSPGDRRAADRSARRAGAYASLYSGSSARGTRCSATWSTSRRG